MSYYIGFCLNMALNVMDYYTGDVIVECDDDNMVYYTTRYWYSCDLNVKPTAKVEEIVNANPDHFTDKFKLLDVNDIDLLTC